MTRDEEVAYHRTFLLFDPTKDYCRMGCHGTTGMGRKIKVDEYLEVLKPEPLIGRKKPDGSPGNGSLPKVDARTNLRKRGWEQPNFQFRYAAFQLIRENIKEIEIVPKIDQFFKRYASKWEENWSVLVEPGPRKFVPIVDENYTVIGHVGRVPETAVIVPEYTPQEVNWVWTALHEYTNLPVLVLESPHGKVPEGWRRIRSDDHSWYALTVATGIDGEVIELVDYEATNGVAIPVDGPGDYISLGRIAASLGGRLAISIFKGLGRSLSRLGGRVLARALALRGGKKLAGKFRFMRGHNADMGIPSDHFDAIAAAAKEVDCILIFRSNKGIAVPLIKRGAPGKPKALSLKDWKTDPETGILTATDKLHFKTAWDNGYYTAISGTEAMRVVNRGGKEVAETVKLDNPFWTVKPGQVIDPKLRKPVVGDYDLLGVAPMRSPGSNVALVPNDPATGDWTGPVATKAAKAVNARLDQPRVLHGAQDQHNRMGLSEGSAYAVFPDGRVHMMPDKRAQEAFYGYLGRQTGAGSYPRPKGPVVDELAARRARR